MYTYTPNISTAAGMIGVTSLRVFPVDCHSNISQARQGWNGAGGRARARGKEESGAAGAAGQA